MSGRFHRLQWILLIALGCLALRLTHLQLIHGRQYAQLADRNRLRLIPAPAPRGMVFDRRGRVLAANHTVLRVAVIPQAVEDLDGLLDRVGREAGVSPEILRRAFERQRGLAFMPATILPAASKAVALRLEELHAQLPGVLVRAETVRWYPGGSLAAHVLGYLGQPTPEDAPRLKRYGVSPQDLVGRAGIEALLEPWLRGRPGGAMIEVNHRGRQVRLVGDRSPDAGQSVTLTLDATLQSLVEAAMGDQAGAVVVLDPSTGDVLALASRPAFNPEVFVLGAPEGVRRLLDDPRAALMNRAALGVYQPGSIVKLVTAAAALETGVVQAQTPIECRGSLTIGDRTIRCWNRDGHGRLTLPDALMQSCNVYMMTLGRRLGLASLRPALVQIGFGQRTGWPLEEQRGHLPSRRLTGGEVAMLAMGQGEILVTPLQVAVMASAFANSGTLVTPRLVLAVGERQADRTGAGRRLPWSRQTLDVVRFGMREVVQDPRGTGHGAWSRAVSIAGKTGTAQTHVPDKTHGWFVGFCPVDRPRVAMAIVAEYGGSGGDLPATVAKAVCEYAALPETL